MQTVDVPDALRRDRAAGGLLLVLGMLTIGTAIYFLMVRPPMLPEDARFTGVAADQLDPRLAAWLSIVFDTLSGFMAGLGIAILAVGYYLMTLRGTILRWSVALALLVAFGRFLASNIALHSDFVPFITALALVAFAAALRLSLHR